MKSRGEEGAYLRVKLSMLFYNFTSAPGPKSEEYGLLIKENNCTALRIHESVLIIERSSIPGASRRATPLRTTEGERDRKRRNHQFSRRSKGHLRARDCAQLSDRDRARLVDPLFSLPPIIIVRARPTVERLYTISLAAESLILLPPRPVSTCERQPLQCRDM